MPRGGPRPGAGRPKGSTSKGKKASAPKADAKKTKAKVSSRTSVTQPGPPPTDEVFVGEVLPANMSPLEYMLYVMNNRKAEPDRRDRMAVAAAPYVHGKMGEQGKKAAKDAAAAAVGGGSRFSAAPPPRRSRVN
jgi:phage terminase small subunit